MSKKKTRGKEYKACQTCGRRITLYQWKKGKGLCLGCIRVIQ